MEKWSTYAWQRAEEESLFSEILNAQKQVVPRAEYATGELKLNYTHAFFTGHTLEIKEDGSGVATIYLRRPSGAKIDLAKKEKFLAGIKLTTPTYAKANHVQNGHSENGYWYATKDNHISVGDMKNPESIFILLHELGHRQPELKEKLKLIDIHVPGPTIHEAEFQSVNERGAWANALQIARGLREKYGLNLMEVFPSLQDFNVFMVATLKIHRYQHEFDITEGKQELLNDSVIKEGLSTLFDKSRKL
jgi:hypothetical protein